MSRRKEISPQRPHTGDKTAQSQRGTPKDHCSTTTSSNNNNNEHSSVGLQNRQETLEESVDTRARESATPAIHLTEEDESSNRADIRTVVEVDETVCDNAPRFDAGKEHALGLLHDAEKFSKHGQHCTPHDTAGPSAEGSSTQREHTNHKDTSSKGESVDTGDRRHHTTSNDMTPGSAEFDRQRKHIETRGTIGPEPVEICRQREHTNTHDTISQESLEFSKQREHNSKRGTISSETLEFGSPGKQTNARGTIGPKSAEFGTQREPTIQHGPNTPTSVGLGSNENGDSLGLHVANTLTPMEFDAQMNHACAKRKTCNATEVEITATEVDSKTDNQLLSGASALTSQNVAEQDDDDSSAKQTDDEHESLENRSSISDSSEDDPGSTAFFTCRLCFSDRILHWVLFPCGHMLCYVCVQNKLICPFCGALVELPYKIRYRFE